MSALVPLKDLTESDRHLAGSKAWRLARLLRGSHPVPPGLVLPAGAAVPGDGEVQPLLAALRAGSSAATFAVRPSPPGEDSLTASWAGILHSRLRVPAADVPRAIAEVRAAARAEIARARALERGLPIPPGDAAVLIQPMIEGEPSGVALSRDPRSGLEGTAVVQSASAPADRVAGGEVPPDRYHFETMAGNFYLHEMEHGVRGRLASLRESEAREVALTARRIERLLGVPVSVEWCFRNERLWVLQVRPISPPAGMSADLAASVRQEISPAAPSPVAQPAPLPAPRPPTPEPAPPDPRATAPVPEPLPPAPERAPQAMQPRTAVSVPPSLPPTQTPVVPAAGQPAPSPELPPVAPPPPRKKPKKERRVSPEPAKPGPAGMAIPAPPPAEISGPAARREEPARVEAPRPAPFPAPAEAPAPPVFPALRPVPGELWARLGFPETAPDLPSPLLRSLLTAIQEGAPAIPRSLCRSPHGPPVKWRDGRAYVNLSLLADACASAALDPTMLLRAFGDPGGDGSDLLAREVRPVSAAVALARRPVALPRLVLRVLRAGAHARILERQLSRRIEEREARIAREPEEPTSADSLHVRVQTARECLDALVVLAGRTCIAMRLLERLLEGAVANPADFLHAVTASAGSSTAALQPEILEIGRTLHFEEEAREKLRALAGAPRPDPAALGGTRAGAEFRKLLRRFGHRAPGEADPAEPRYGEDPAPLLRLLLSLAAREEPPDPELWAEERARRESQAWAGLEAAGRLRRLLVERVARTLRADLVLAEEIRDRMARLLALDRRRDLLLGSRWEEAGLLDRPGDIFCLGMEEILRGLARVEDSRPLRERVRERRAERDRESAEDPPGLLVGEAAAERPAVRVSPGERLRGLGISPGRAEGTLVFLRTREDWARVSAGSILLLTAAGSGIAPLLALATGIVVERGGHLSRGAIVARACGVPAVSNLPGITDRLREGDRVVVDGGAGTVTRIGAGPR